MQASGRPDEDLFAFWPNQTTNPFTAVLNNTQKYVAPTTLQDPLPWSNSTLLRGDAAAAVATLKQQLDKHLLVMGSGELLQSLMRRNQVDKYVLLIQPLVLGTGRRLFAEGSPMTTFQLVDTKTTASGVVIATYLADTPTTPPATNGLSTAQHAK